MQRKAIYRPTIEPIPSLPFALRSVGHYIVDSSYFEDKHRKGFVQLFWCIAGEGLMVFDKREHPLRAGEICFYFPGDIHDFKSRCEEWNYRWLTFDGPMNTAMVNGFGFKKQPSKAGECPEELFLKIEKAIRDITPRGQVMAAAACYQILSAARAGGLKKDPEPGLPERCISLIRDNFDNPSFDVNSLAEILDVNRSSISRIFREEMHTTLKGYLIACRIQRALSLLKETSLPVAKIARACGYSNPDYFAKAIRKASGFVPREFRRR